MLSRRNFLRTSGLGLAGVMASQQMLAAVAPSPVPSPAAKKKTTANDKVNLGFIGLGQQAMNLLNGFIGMDGLSQTICSTKG